VSRSIHRRVLVLGLLALTVAGVGVSKVSGAIPNNGTYWACLTKATGEFDIINYPKVKCGKGERLIKWSQQGPTGTQGPEGGQGPQGPAGPADWNAIGNKPSGFADGVDNVGVTGVKLTRVLGAATLVQGGQNGSATAACPAGSRVTGGGFVSSSLSLFSLASSRPSDTMNGWDVGGLNTSPTLGLQILAYAVCMTVEPAGTFTTAKKGFLPAKVKKAMKKRGR
jgi:hypothetical protein